MFQHETPEHARWLLSKWLAVVYLIGADLGGNLAKQLSKRTGVANCLSNLEEIALVYEGLWLRALARGTCGSGWYFRCGRQARQERLRGRGQEVDDVRGGTLGEQHEFHGDQSCRASEFRVRSIFCKANSPQTVDKWLPKIYTIISNFKSHLVVPSTEYCIDYYRCV